MEESIHASRIFTAVKMVKGLNKLVLCVKQLGVAGPKFSVRICGYRVGAFDPIQNIYKKTFTNSAGPDETPQNAASHQGLRC